MSSSILETILKIVGGSTLSAFVVNIVMNFSRGGTENRRVGRNLLIVLFIIVISAIVGSILHHRGFYWISNSWPIILTVIIAITYNGWMTYFMWAISKINSRIDTITNQNNSNIVQLSDDFPLGPRIQSGVARDDILHELISTSSADKQRSIARGYNGNFIIWECKLFNWELMDNGKLRVSLGIGTEIYPSICALALESESAHIKTLKPGADIIIDGRIYSICIASKDITIDNVTLTNKSPSI